MITFIDWMVMLSDMLLSGNDSRITAARSLITYQCRTRANDEYANRDLPAIRLPYADWRSPLV